MRTIVVLLAIALSCSFAADAQTLYQCAGPDGNSYQQEPCTASRRMVRAIQITPEPTPTPQQLAQRARKAAEDRAESQFLSHLAGTDQLWGYSTRSGRSPRRRSGAGLPDPCSRAMTGREHRLALAGLDRNVDLLRRLDADVDIACHKD